MTSEHNNPNLGIASTPEREQKRHSADVHQLEAFAIDAARLMSDSHCEDVRVFDVRELSDVTDFILIATGTSDRQMKSVADDVEELAAEIDLQKYGREEDKAATWIILDMIDVVCHLFEPTARAHYDLEMMWGDAPQVSWKRD